jgi:MFS transporter, NNP family, nitrate/nitrite transporter
MLAPANKVGSVTGVVGAAGGLGGFVPPLIMGGLHGMFGSYALGLAALAVVAVGTLAFTVTVVQRSVRAHRGQRATPQPISHRTVGEALSIKLAPRLSAEC